MSPFTLTGRHRARGARVRLSLRPAVPRHAEPPGGTSEQPGHRPTRTKAVLVAFAVVVVVVGVALGLTLRRPDDAPAPAVALPTFSISAPAMATPAATQPRGREIHRRTTPRPTTPPASAAAPVLLGPADVAGSLTTYCRRAYGPLTIAVFGREGWQCAGFFRRPRTIDLNAVCRSLFGANARARLLNDNDPQSWRCYRTGR